jgi:hypothetical protein
MGSDVGALETLPVVEAREEPSGHGQAADDLSGTVCTLWSLITY